MGHQSVKTRGLLVALLAAGGAFAQIASGGDRLQETVLRMLTGANAVRPESIVLTDEERRSYLERTGTGAPPPPLVVYAGVSDTGLVGYVVLDDVRGKDQMITYAVAVGPDLRIRSLEILEYREAYGGEVRNSSWRRQFVGKSPADPLRPGREVSAISGATISSRAVTLGVRRVLQLLDIIRQRLPR